MLYKRACVNAKRLIQVGCVGRVWGLSQEFSQNSGTVPKLSYKPLIKRSLWAHVSAPLQTLVKIKWPTSYSSHTLPACHDLCDRFSQVLDILILKVKSRADRFHFELVGQGLLKRRYLASHHGQ